MRLAVRPRLTAGVAVLGATLITIAPAITPDNHQRTVRLAAFDAIDDVINGLSQDVWVFRVSIAEILDPDIAREIAAAAAEQAAAQDLTEAAALASGGLASADTDDFGAASDAGYAPYEAFSVSYTQGQTLSSDAAAYVTDAQTADTAAATYLAAAAAALDAAQADTVDTGSAGGDQSWIHTILTDIWAVRVWLADAFDPAHGVSAAQLATAEEQEEAALTWMSEVQTANTATAADVSSLIADIDDNDSTDAATAGSNALTDGNNASFYNAEVSYHADAAITALSSAHGDTSGQTAAALTAAVSAAVSSSLHAIQADVNQISAAALNPAIAVSDLNSATAAILDAGADINGILLSLLP